MRVPVERPHPIIGWLTRRFRDWGPAAGSKTRRGSWWQSAASRSGGPESLALPGHRRQGLGQQGREIPGRREGIGGQVGPGGRGGRPLAVGQLRDKPWCLRFARIRGWFRESARDFFIQVRWQLPEFEETLLHLRQR
jgi:hypothetical protein